MGGKRQSLIQRLVNALKAAGKGKNKKAKRVSKNEFRYNNQTKHPNYIFEEENGKYHSIGITSSDRTFGKKNLPLVENPQKSKKGKPAHLRNGIIVDKKKNYSTKTIKNMSFSKIDEPNVKSKVRNYKRNRKMRKKKT